MKDFILGWIVVQMVCYGVAVANIRNEIIDRTYDCSPATEKFSPILAGLLPIGMYAVYSSPVLEKRIDEYCTDKFFHP